MPTNISPNMNLIVPIVGQEPGPQYAIDIDTSLYTLIDQHDHSSGKGVLVTPSGMNISADLPFNVNNATLLRSVRFTPQASPISSPSDLSTLYTVTNLTYGSDLYFNTGNGAQVALVLNGAVVGTPGSIAGLVPPASATYTPLSGTFTWSSGVNIPAAMNQGPTDIRQMVLNGFGVTLAANASQAANYQLTFPIALPGSQELLSLGPSGQITETPIDGTSLVFSGGTLEVGTITPANQGPLNYAAAASSGAFNTTSTTPVLVTNQSISVTVSGVRPVMLVLQPSGGQAYIGVRTLASPVQANFFLNRGASVISNHLLFADEDQAVNPGPDIRVPPGAITFMDAGVVGGGSATYTYTLTMQIGSGSVSPMGFAENISLVAYEM